MPQRPSPPASSQRASGLDCVDPGISVQEQAHPVPRYWDVTAVPKVEDDVTRGRGDADDAVGEAPGIRDSVDDDCGAGDRAAGADLPEDPAARGGDAVEEAVVRAEEHASAPHRGRRVHVRA